MKRHLLALACVLGTAGWLASAAAACHSEITAGIDCSGNVTWTATAWTGPGADDRTRTNPLVYVWASYDGGRSFGSPIAQGAFNSGNHYSFGGRVTAPSSASSIVLKVQEQGNWGNGDRPSEARTFTATKSGCATGGGGGGSQCRSENMLTNVSSIALDNARAKVTFTVGQGCSLQLSLASYQAPGPTWDASKADQQRYYRSVTNTVGAGTYTWTVDVPSCYFQVDFVKGEVITQGAPMYGNRLIKALNGGTTACSTSSGGTTAPTTPAPTPAAAPVAAPTISLAKLERVGPAGSFIGGPVTASVGQTVSYQLVVSNTGSTTISVTLKDDGCDSGTLAPAGPQAIIAGASLTYTCSHRIVAADGARYVNTALATAENAGSTKANATATAVANVSAPHSVLGARTTLKPAKHVKAKKVTKRAKPARAVIRSASFTG